MNILTVIHLWVLLEAEIMKICTRMISFWSKAINRSPVTTWVSLHRMSICQIKITLSKAVAWAQSRRTPSLSPNQRKINLSSMTIVSPSRHSRRRRLTTARTPRQAVVILRVLWLYWRKGWRINRLMSLRWIEVASVGYSPLRLFLGKWTNLKQSICPKSY